jgi:hypothetical protein
VHLPRFSLAPPSPSGVEGAAPPAVDFGDEYEGDIHLNEADRAFIDDEGLAEGERVDFEDDGDHQVMPHVHDAVFMCVQICGTGAVVG